MYDKAVKKKKSALNSMEQKISTESDTWEQKSDILLTDDKKTLSKQSIKFLLISHFTLTVSLINIY